MNEPFLWFIDYHGSLYKYILKANEWQRISRENSNSRTDTFKRISSTKTSAWCVGGDQNVYVTVYRTDLPVRVCESTYENQRWSVRTGWSSSLLFSDRWSWSSKNGKKELKKEDFQLPSRHWSWEGDWFIDLSVDSDIEGWQYAIDFPATYYPTPGRLTFVRRRKWARYRSFNGFDQWIMVPPISSEDPFQDITVGGEQLQTPTQGFLSVWAVTFLGKIVFRDGVTRDCPTGTNWIQVSSDDLNLVQIHVGSTGLLWGCTWDGNAVTREGITHTTPMGTSWVEVKPPLNNPLFQVVCGTEALWAVAKNSKVFFRRSITLEKKLKERKTKDSKEHDWVEMCGLSLFITIGPNEQVWSIGKDDRKLYIRTNVTSNELVGREWELLKLDKNIQNSSQVALQWYWIDSGSCDVDSAYFVKSNLIRTVSSTSLSSLTSSWRTYILKSLTERNAEMSSYGLFSYQDAFYDKMLTTWSKRCECDLLTDRLYNTWSKCHLKFTKNIDTSQSELVIYYKGTRKGHYEELIFHQEHFQCIHRLKHHQRYHTFAIQTNDKVNEEQLIILDMDTEKTMFEWMQITQKNITVEYDTSFWVTSKLGNIFACNVESFYTDFWKKYWAPVDGHLQKVVCGVRPKEIWGVGVDGTVYVYKPTKLFEQVNVVQYSVYENQRWNPVEGYSERLLPSDRWNWSDENGLQHLTKENHVLPSSSYKWQSDWSICYENADEDGWQYAVDFPRCYHKRRGINDYVRRRRWLRTAKVTWLGPWQEIKSDVKVVDLSISIDNDLHSIWAVSINGDVLARTSLTDDGIQTAKWRFIPTDIRITSISVGYKSRIWCSGCDGSCFLRSEVTSEYPFGKLWIHILKEEYAIRTVCAGRCVVLALDYLGGLFYRSNVSDAYPEGTNWLPLIENVSSVSVNANDQVCVVQGGQVKVLVLDDLKILSTSFTLLLDGWESACCRSFVRTNKYNEDNTSVINLQLTSEVENEIDAQDEIDSAMELETANKEEKIDPYSVDIYNFYKTPDSDSDKDLSH